MTSLAKTCLVILIYSLALLSEKAVSHKTTSSVIVHAPHELVRAGSGTYDHREALFGIPLYGGSIEERVIYANNDMCKPFTNRSWKGRYILLIERGGCTFVTKVRNAELAGAAAVVIADNKCQCKFAEFCLSKEQPTTFCEFHEPIMADDGTGKDIKIPSVLLFKQDADPILKALEEEKTVKIELAWTLPSRPDGRVEWSLWTSPADFVTKDLKNDFKEVVAALGDSATFTPHMYIYDGIESGCQGEDGKNKCSFLCTNEGRYCSRVPPGLYFGLTGASVVEESVRSLCISKLYSGDDVSTRLHWWNYSDLVDKRCNAPQHFFDDECIKSIMAETHIDFDKVNRCIAEAGGFETPGENSILEAEVRKKEKEGIVVMPVVYINDVPIRGELEFATVFKGICAGFAHNRAPSICDRCAKCDDEQKCVLSGGICRDRGRSGEHSNRGRTSWRFWFLIFITVGVGFLTLQQRRTEWKDIDGISYELPNFSPVNEAKGLISIDANAFKNGDTQ